MYIRGLFASKNVLLTNPTYASWKCHELGESGLRSLRKRHATEVA